ncbi:MAG: hypothetical protein KJ069_10855 [Anaerolineae bacterium]|nr:hypothetical protein [Anaerolineae bacterium]
MTAFALVPSPLVGPLTWKLVADQLTQQGHQVIIANPVDSEGDTRPFGEQHADSAAVVIKASGIAPPWILVGHSGAGPLLPMIADRLASTPTGFIFVDAGLPTPQASRLEMIKAESPAWVTEFENYLMADGRFPTWSDTDLQGEIADDTLRRQMLTEIRPRGLRYFSEKLPVSHHWSEVSCGYIQFTEAYNLPARRAIEQGWPFIQFQAGHFHMLVDAQAVTQALVMMAAQLLQAP